MGFVVMILLALAWGFAMGKAISNPLLAMLAGGIGGYAIAIALQYFNLF